MFDAGHNRSVSPDQPGPAHRFGWLRTRTGGGLDPERSRVGVVEVSAVIPEHNVRQALDGLVEQFRSVRSYRCRFRGNASRPNLDLISKDLRAALERLGHEVGRTSDGTRGVRWLEGSGNIDVDEATVRVLAAYVLADGFVQMSAGDESWYWTFQGSIAERHEGRHPLALMDCRGRLTTTMHGPETIGRTA